MHILSYLNVLSAICSSFLCWEMSIEFEGGLNKEHFEQTKILLTQGRIFNEI